MCGQRAVWPGSLFHRQPEAGGENSPPASVCPKSGARRPGRCGSPASALMLPRQRGAKWSRVTQTAAAQGLLLWTGWSRVNVEPVIFPLLWTRWSRVNRPVIPTVCVTLDHLMQVTRGGSGRGKLSMNTGSENPFSDWCYEKPLRQTARQNIQSGQSSVDG